MMEIIKVGNKRLARKFLAVPHIIYKDDKNWICPLDTIIESIFDPKKNGSFSDGEAERWILLDSNKNLIGRVAAFYNKQKANKYDPPTGGLGFFECINDQEAANLLFDAAKAWLESKGMGAMDGPINFGENDNFWGLLVEGFSPPAFGMNYNPPYYKSLFEEYGFKPFFEQESRHLNLEKPFPERFWKIAEWVMRKPGYSFEHIHKNNIEKYVRDIVEIHNQAWIFHEHYTPLTFEKVLKSFNYAKQIIREDFIWFAYHEGEPIAFLVMYPDMNQVFRLFNGKLTLWNKIRFLFLKRSKLVNRSRVTIMGVIPKYQGIGIESAVFWHMQKPLMETGVKFKELEISWVGDFNPKMKATMNAMGAGPGKIHITYRKLFVDHVEFKEASKIPEIKEKQV